METENDIENNNKTKYIIEDRITKTLLYDDDKKTNECYRSILLTTIFLSINIIIIALVIIIIKL
jgi:hypothetical protein